MAADVRVGSFASVWHVRDMSAYGGTGELCNLIRDVYN